MRLRNAADAVMIHLTASCNAEDTRIVRLMLELSTLSDLEAHQSDSGVVVQKLITIDPLFVT